jgi:hypothetical protein
MGALFAGPGIVLAVVTAELADDHRVRREKLDLYDGIHPTEAAHARVAQIFLDAVRDALGRKAAAIADNLAAPATAGAAHL